jgi:DNA helicase-2/ATP-dependent DNA helicase PcrA
MKYVADLHVHSRYSRATSREADLAGYYRWARVKGIGVVGTGDFTHPGWLAELEDQLVEKDGLYALKDAPEGSPLEGAVPADSQVRFILTTEISSIYKKHGQVRKVHSLIGVPTLEDARRLGTRLATIGNIASDGRPILGLDPKDLLSILLETSPDAFLIPAHIWTPWFSLFGSKSGFDRIEECFEELTPHIFALETGLSSDPLMNWRWSALDRYRLISNSDAHSPGKLGREANLFDTEPSWQGLVQALRTGEGFRGTFEFYPEEGKYHLDGHRKCGVCMEPDQTLKTGGMCPVCGTPVTVGVLNRVLTLADRAEPVRPRAAESFRYLIPLPELLAEIAGSGSGSKSVSALYARIITAFGSEYGFLLDAAVEDIARSQGGLLAEAVRRMREGLINPRPGYDGEFGVIRVFDDAELVRLRGQDELFPEGRASSSRKARAALPVQAARAPRDAAEDSTLLDDEQRAIVDSDSRRSLVLAGPGTGKTRLLVGWIARHVRAGAVEPVRVLALTFTNRAAGELKDRLALLLPGQAEKITAATFHSFCWSVLRERDPSLLAVYAPSQRAELLGTLLPSSETGRVKTESAAYRDALAERMERCWEGMEEPDAYLQNMMDRYEEELRRIGGADLSSLVVRLGRVLQADSALRAELSARWDLIALDELQDINRPQYELLMQLCPSAESVLGIGDPDQAIYGFRGSDRALFRRFGEQTAARTFHLTRNYRSAGAIVAAADALIAPARAQGAPPLTAVRSEGLKIRLLKASDPQEEGKLIADFISDLVGGVDSVSVDAAREREPRNVTEYRDRGSYAFSDIAVLFRTRAVRDALLPALAGAGLPLTLGSSTPLAEEEPFRSLVAALRLVVTPEDPVALRILRAHAAGANRAVSVEDWLSRRVELARKAGSEGVCALMDDALAGLIRFDASQPEVELGGEVLRDFAAEHGTDLPGFLSRVSLCARESERARSAQKVALLTFHAAKGLEFPVVFIAGAEEGITPRYSADSAPLPDDLEEERRLFYVAVTRARDALFISQCARRRVHGKMQDESPSRFLADIPARCRVDKTPRRPPRDRQLTLFG